MEDRERTDTPRNTMSPWKPFARRAIVAGKQVEHWTPNTKTLDAPLRWRLLRHALVVSDLFHESVPDDWIDRIFAVMALADRHTFQVLTKRPGRMREYLADRLRRRFEWGRLATAAQDALEGRRRPVEHVKAHVASRDPGWPLPNVWLGTSVEGQATADERIPLLLATPAAVRFVSVEPMLGPVDFRWAKWDSWTDEDRKRRPSINHLDGLRMLDWVIVGGESGPGARPCDVAWIRSVVAQCREAAVPCFVKQVGAYYVDAANGVGGARATQPDPQLVPPIRRLSDPKGGDPAEWPEDLRVREYPEEGGSDG